MSTTVFSPACNELLHYRIERIFLNVQSPQSPYLSRFSHGEEIVLCYSCTYV